ncbi:hypothetical protein NMY22_g10389 [Coprinellus aureogranulatus]|nr:hypothetical protein NMY22_g10389 [Coprinellus aureogranulatus]
MASPPNPTRRVRVDDTDAGITYNGPWVLDTSGSLDSTGYLGPTFQSSLHGVTGTTATFSFVYEGSAVSVLGTVNMSNSSTGVTDPSWRCFLDGREGVIPGMTTAPFNNWGLCDFNTSQVSAGTHNLSVQVTSSSRTFWLDYIDYLPSPSATTTAQHPFVSVPVGDPAITYDNTWRSFYEGCNITSTSGGTVTMDFTGTGLDWYGMIPTEVDHGTSTGTYSLDGEPPTTFTLRGIQGDSDPSQYFQRFFSTPDRTYGNHSIAVTYLGRQTPLTITNLVIRDSTANSPRPGTGGTDSAPTPTPGPDLSPAGSGSSSKISAGAIAGAVIGGVALIIALIVVGLMLARRRRRLQRPQVDLSVQEAFTGAPPAGWASSGHSYSNPSLGQSMQYSAPSLGVGPGGGLPSMSSSGQAYYPNPSQSMQHLVPNQDPRYGGGALPVSTSQPPDDVGHLSFDGGKNQTPSNPAPQVVPPPQYSLSRATSIQTALPPYSLMHQSPVQ